MKKIKHHNKSKKKSTDEKKSKKIIVFGIIFGGILIALGITAAYFLSH